MAGTMVAIREAFREARRLLQRPHEAPRAPTPPTAPPRDGATRPFPSWSAPCSPPLSPLAVDRSRSATPGTTSRHEADAAATRWPDSPLPGTRWPDSPLPSPRRGSPRPSPRPMAEQTRRGDGTARRPGTAASRAPERPTGGTRRPSSTAPQTPDRQTGTSTGTRTRPSSTAPQTPDRQTGTSTGTRTRPSSTAPHTPDRQTGTSTGTRTSSTAPQTPERPTGATTTPSTTVTRTAERPSGTASSSTDPQTPVRPTGTTVPRMPEGSSSGSALGPMAGGAGEVEELGLDAEEVRQLRLALELSRLTVLEEGVLPQGDGMPRSAGSPRRPATAPPAAVPTEGRLGAGGRAEEGQGEGEGRPGKCIICWDSPADVACVPCGHVCGCNDCINIVRKQRKPCPVCRAKIFSVLKVFLSGQA